MAGAYLRRGHRGLSTLHCAQQRTPRPVDLGGPLLSTHFQNHGRSGSSLGRTAHHRLVHLPRAVAGEYVPRLWVGEGTRNAPRDPLIHIVIAAPTQPILSQLLRSLCTKVPRWYYLSPPVPVPTSSRRPGPQCARAQPGTKTQGCGGRPLRTIATNAVRNTPLYSGSIPGGRRGTCVQRNFTVRSTENFHLKKIAQCGNFSLNILCTHI